jgi:hypothetical protein
VSVSSTVSLALPPALSAWQLRQTSPQVVALIDQRLNDHTEGQIAAQLNAEGYVSGAGSPSDFNGCRSGLGFGDTSRTRGGAS